MVKLRLPFLVIHIVVLKEAILNTQYILLLLPTSTVQVRLRSNKFIERITDSVIYLHATSIRYILVDSCGNNSVFVTLASAGCRRIRQYTAYH